MAKNKSTFERLIRWFGKWCVTPSFAIGSGVITTVAVSSISVIAGLSLPWLIPILLFVFVAESTISVYLFKDAVPDTLAAVFIHDIFNDLSPVKKILLCLGIFAAVGGGFALAALTYTSAVAAVTAILGLFSVACPPVGIAVAAILAIVGFIAFTSLLVKWISTAIKNDMHIQALNFFKEIFTRDESKPLSQQILEGVFKLTFTAAIIAVSIVGTIATLGTMQKGLVEFLSLIPSANVLAVKIASGVIAFGLMGVARLPWALQSVCSVFSWLGEKAGQGIYLIACEIGKQLDMYDDEIELSNLNANGQDDALCETIVTPLLKTSAAIVHGLSFGAIAQSGGGKVLSEMMTDMQFPMDASTTDLVGQITSLATGTLMAIGIGAYSIFATPKKQANKNENVANQTLQKSFEPK